MENEQKLLHSMQNHDLENQSRQKLVQEIKAIIGYEFKDSKLLEQAFTHHSYLDQDKTSIESYERLEYVGDAVLNFLTAREHYLSYPNLAPGQLTKLRAANVDTEKLARVAFNFKLHTFLRHKKPKLAKQIEDFEKAILEYPIHSTGLIDAPKNLADLVESLVGAIYMDSNSMDTTWKIVEKLLDPMITPSTVQTHPVTMLYEECQKNKAKIDCKDFWDETGEIEFIVDGESIGKAKYTAKKSIANNRAAQEAYRKFVEKLRQENTGHDQH
ncbi:hypothetical protein ACJIZ3_002684 [Penstemon smallii]|uniref:RNase III domain-containing protein n=1 Tax=Penstemon smallii TaxID=265156 RepID=A0ABD3U8Y8_9LAMI